MPETPIFSPAGRDCNALVAPRLLIPLLSGAVETMVSIQGFFSSSSSTSSFPVVNVTQEIVARFNSMWAKC